MLGSPLKNAPAKKLNFEKSKEAICHLVALIECVHNSVIFEVGVAKYLGLSTVNVVAQDHSDLDHCI